ncbi:succinate dehydrogenase assembly factor 4 [Paeniroseomonas aquatica]|uniref:succinate dehydrogenase assembly factor 4 n=1 Tax=Paeniroseomonas aquatica TaxID=373043 RepID=UPI0036183F80
MSDPTPLPPSDPPVPMPPSRRHPRPRGAALADRGSAGPGDPRAGRSRDAPAGDPPGEPPLRMKEVGGPTGPEPTRYGDWERKGRVTDF